MSPLIQMDALSLKVPSDIALKVDPEQFKALAIANRHLKLECTAIGELIVNPPTGGESGYRNIKIAYFLVKWVEEQGGNGIPFDSSTGFQLPNGAIRSPDAAWVRADRWNSLTSIQRSSFVPLCPDFVIELRSSSDSRSQLQIKMQEYQANGTQLGWLIDPQSQQVVLYRSGQEPQVLANPVYLQGEAVLPGFRLDVSRLWR